MFEGNAPLRCILLDTCGWLPESARRTTAQSTQYSVPQHAFTWGSIPKAEGNCCDMHHSLPGMIRHADGPEPSNADGMARMCHPLLNHPRSTTNFSSALISSYAGTETGHLVERGDPTESGPSWRVQPSHFVGDDATIPARESSLVQASCTAVSCRF